MNSLLKDYNLVYEERGIILGIMNFILDNMNKYKRINIENKMYFKIIRQLFPMFRVTREYDDETTSLNIYTKSRKIKDNGVIINNLDNIKKIRSKKKHFYLLPWFNVNNPICMFKYDKSKPKNNIKKLKKYVEKFNIIRLKEYSYERIPIMSYKFNILFWDIFVEYRILNRYSKLTNSNINTVYDFLTKFLGGFNINVPTYIPRYIERPYIQKEYIMIDNNLPMNPSINPPIYNPSIDAINPPINSQSIDTINPPINGPSIDAINPPIYNPSIDAINPPIYNPSIDAINPPINGPSIDAINPPINNPSIDAINQPINNPSIDPINQPINGPSIDPINPPINNPSIDTINPPINNPSIGISTDPIVNPSNNIGNNFLEKFVSTINNKVGAMNNIMMANIAYIK
jgi:hypothetical protein